MILALFLVGGDWCSSPSQGYATSFWMFLECAQFDTHTPDRTPMNE